MYCMLVPWMGIWQISQNLLAEVFPPNVSAADRSLLQWCCGVHTFMYVYPHTGGTHLKPAYTVSHSTTERSQHAVSWQKFSEWIPRDSPMTVPSQTSFFKVNEDVLLSNHVPVQFKTIAWASKMSLAVLCCSDYILSLLLRLQTT